MSDDAILRRLMRDLGISVEAVAIRCGVDRSYASKQIRGERPLQGCVQAALLQALDERTLAALPHVARLLRKHGEFEAAEACERLGTRLRDSGACDSRDSRST